MMINVTKTYLPKRSEFDRHVNDIFDSGWLTNNGQKVQELQTKLEAFLGVKHVLLVSNGTLALQVAIKLLDLKGEVITTPFTFAATSSSVIWEGLKPTYCDIDEETYCLDSKKLEACINDKTSAILPVHVFGNACEVEEIDRIARKYNLKVIYDAAHAFGVNYNGKSLLSYGDVSTLSFHSTKVFHTIEGGALIINDDSLYEKAKLLINFGIAGPDKIVELGINAKMNEFQAAMGLCVLDDINLIISNRERAYRYYMNKLFPGLVYQKSNKCGTMNYSYFPILFNSEEELLRTKYELNCNNIYPRRYFYPSLSMVERLNPNQSQTPIADNISNRILCLPMYDALTQMDLDMIIEAVNSSITVSLRKDA
ncbi:DegT/DnrJ/EryC1/StrS family aminotransferase [Alloiococcus sp. CFN-8]|uniref:DegT/DnrJ/EryC1/StrS family aminotransferase n=1 Tax=Alloiococcus sp. CFN-8 TaxID=3416081 RepID=UPI003CECEDDF